MASLLQPQLRTGARDGEGNGTERSQLWGGFHQKKSRSLEWPQKHCPALCCPKTSSSSPKCFQLAAGWGHLTSSLLLSPPPAPSLRPTVFFLLQPQLRVDKEGWIGAGRGNWGSWGFSGGCGHIYSWEQGAARGPHITHPAERSRKPESPPQNITATTWATGPRSNPAKTFPKKPNQSPKRSTGAARAWGAPCRGMPAAPGAGSQAAGEPQPHEIMKCQSEPCIFHSLSGHLPD